MGFIWGLHDYNIKLTNECKHPVRLAIHYIDTKGVWKTDGWWNFTKGESNFLASNNGMRLSTNKSTLYYYAETTDNSNYVWKGNHNYSIDGQLLGMRKIVDKNGDTDIPLKCR